MADLRWLTDNPLLWLGLLDQCSCQTKFGLKNDFWSRFVLESTERSNFPRSLLWDLKASAPSSLLVSPRVKFIRVLSHLSHSSLSSNQAIHIQRQLKTSNQKEKNRQWRLAAQAKHIIGYLLCSNHYWHLSLGSSKEFHFTSNKWVLDEVPLHAPGEAIESSHVW